MHTYTHKTFMFMLNKFVFCSNSERAVVPNRTFKSRGLCLRSSFEYIQNLQNASKICETFDVKPTKPLFRNETVSTTGLISRFLLNTKRIASNFLQLPLDISWMTLCRSLIIRDIVHFYPARKRRKKRSVLRFLFVRPRLGPGATFRSPRKASSLRLRQIAPRTRLLVSNHARRRVFQRI